MKNKIFSVILAVSMTAPFLLQTVSAQNSTITISSEKDLIKFSKNCTLDTWSHGKTVNLTCDIDMKDTDFSSVPTFGGTFNGNGYTISGVNISKNGSNLGFFRYIQENGKVTNLKICANVLPGGSKSFIGGVAGENAGTIENCEFEGDIKGENVIGGIAGINTGSGRIISCGVSGSIIGENSTGGIAGKNEGLILSSENNAAINTVYEEKKREISSINTDTGAIIESYKNTLEENEEETLLGHTDTGGIAGYTSGIIQGCTNNADVGYQHIGYNVGGVAGRQCGYLLGCKNNGTVKGRKDVGGIAGQMEPYIILNTSENVLNDIHKELNRLHSMINDFSGDSGSLNSNAEKHLSAISEYAKNAQDSTETMLNYGTDFIDDNLGEINAQAAIISNTLDKLPPVFDNLQNGADNISQALDDMKNALDKIEISAPNLKNEVKDIRSAIEYIKDGEETIKKAEASARKAVQDLDDALEFDNKTQVKRSVRAISDSLLKIIRAKQKIKSAAEDIENILKNKPESFNDIKINAEEIIDNIKTINTNIDNTINALQTISNSLDEILLNTETDPSSFKSAARNIESAINSMGDAMNCIQYGLEDLGSALNNAYDKLQNYADDAAEQLNIAKKDLSAAASSLSYSAEDIKDALGDMKQIISDLSKEEPLEFVKLGEDFKNASTDLFGSLSDISAELDALKNTFSDEKDKITDNLNSISSQINLIMNLMIGEFEELQNSETDLSDIFLDVSDEDLENTKQGKVFDCQNFGRIEGDRNIGGITGAMAIEYSKDPEDEIEKPNTLNFTYKTKAILQECINNGEVSGKKDCIGGVAGLAEIGTVYQCENYADAESTGGNYVGGIAGKSESTLRKNYSKCTLSGKRYVGGIAGKADSAASCYSIVNVSGDESIGAICGACESSEKITGSFFIDNGLGAIDGISFKSSAEPISYNELKNIPGIPKRFISFTVTFIADGNIIETQQVKYGEKTAGIKYPEIPDKKGHFGNWHKIENSAVTENITVTCEYEPYITVLSSIEKNSGGKLPLALAEGEFDDKAELHVTEHIDSENTVRHNIKTYDISLINTDIQKNEDVTLRFLNENKDKVTAWSMQNGEWEQIKTTPRGRYVILNTTGTHNTIRLKYEQRGFGFIFIIIAALLAAVVGIILLKKLKFSKKKNKKTAE